MEALETMKKVTTAIRNGDRKSVEDALSQDPTLAHGRDENGVSLICLAIYHGQNEIANLLAENRDDLDIFEATVIDNAERVQQLVVANLNWSTPIRRMDSIPWVTRASSVV